MASKLLFLPGRHVLQLSWNRTVTPAVNGATHLQSVREVSKVKKMQMKQKKLQARKAAPSFVPRSFLLQKLKAGTVEFDKDKLLAREPVDQEAISIIEDKPMLYFHDIMRLLREESSPEMGNRMGNIVQVEAALDMRTDKLTKYKANFNSTITIPNNFTSGKPNKVIALCESAEMQDEALKAGAAFAGAMEIIRALEKGEISSFEYTHVVSTPAMLLVATKIRKILKDKLPTRKDGNVGENVIEMINHFREGKTIASASEGSPQFAHVTLDLGPMNFSDQHLRENLIAYINALDQLKGYKSRPYGPFVHEATVKVQSGQEKFLLHIPTATMTPEEISEWATKAALGELEDETTAKTVEDFPATSLGLEDSEAETLSQEDIIRLAEEERERLIAQERMIINMTEKQLSNHREKMKAEKKAKEQARKEMNEQLRDAYRQERLQRLGEKTRTKIDLERQYRLPLHI